MKELLKVSQNRIGDDKVNSVSARELHKALGLAKSQFNRWIKTNLLDNPFFTENIDYIVHRLNVDGLRQNSRGSWIDKTGKVVEVEDYILTLDTAKHLAMLSKTTKAHQIRDYFIEIEKKFWQVSQTKVSSFENLDRAKMKELKLQVQDLQELSKPVLEFSKALQTENPYTLTVLEKITKENLGFSLFETFQIDFSETLFLPTELGKFIGVSGAEMNRKLKERGFQIRDGKHWKLTEKGVEFGNDVSEEFPQLKWKIDVLL
jgi:anti-repressor protein